MLNILLPAIVKQKSFNSNPRILRLQNKLINYSAVKESTILGIYLIDNINSINKNSFNTDSSYCGFNKNFVIKKPLNSWDFLKDFKSKAGIYQFVFGSDSYIGSTKDIFKRCFIQHKNNAFTNTNKHKLFYTFVVKHGWNDFTLNILFIAPNYVHKFSEQFPDYILIDKEIWMSQDLTNYELTIAEQLQLDYYKLH